MTMSRTTPAAAGPSLLAVFAHPDDEALACGGLLAWWATISPRTSLLCLTAGEQGSGGPTARRRHPGGPGQTADETRSADDPRPADAARLAGIRAEELDAAAGILDIRDVTLLRHEDGMLPWTDPARLDADIAEVIDRVAADVVVTFDADGLYWHPDHIAVHERTTAVVAACSTPAPALYYVTMPRGAMRAVVDHARELAAGLGTAPPDAVLGITDPDAFGASAPAPSLILDAGAFAARKLRAIHCHRSQLRNDALSLVTPDTAPRLLGAEHYRRADIGARGDTLLDRLGAGSGPPATPRGLG